MLYTSKYYQYKDDNPWIDNILILVVGQIIIIIIERVAILKTSHKQTKCLQNSLNHHTEIEDCFLIFSL